jgi:hypothetical protein
MTAAQSFNSVHVYPDADGYFPHQAQVSKTPIRLDRRFQIRAQPESKRGILNLIQNILILIQNQNRAGYRTASRAHARVINEQESLKFYKLIIISYKYKIKAILSYLINIINILLII